MEAVHYKKCHYSYKRVNWSEKWRIGSSLQLTCTWTNLANSQYCTSPFAMHFLPIWVRQNLRAGNSPSVGNCYAQSFDSIFSGHL